MNTIYCASLCQRDRDRDRIHCALRYIEENLGDPLSARNVAQQCHVSTFHFHRQFHEAVGEPVGQYVRRLRMEKAALRLVYSSDSVEELAAAASYESAPAFFRAFKAHFGIAPSLYRQLKRKSACFKYNSHHWQTDCPVISLVPSMLRWLPARRVAYIRRVGGYNHAVPSAWAALRAYKSLEQFLADGHVCIGVAHDIPRITAECRLRYDACVAVPDDMITHGEVGIRYLKAGCYAIFDQQQPCENVWHTFQTVYDQWLLGSGETLADTPVFAVYSGDPIHHKFEVNIPLNSVVQTQCRLSPPLFNKKTAI